MNHDKWLQKAVELAVDNVYSGGGPFAAVIVKDGEQIASGTNQVQAECNPAAHAELAAIQQACRQLGTLDLSDCTLYASGEPCPMCLGASYWANIGEIYYAASKQDAWEAARYDNPVKAFFPDQQLPPEKRAVPFIQQKTAHAVKPFEEWNKLQQM